MTSVEHEVGSYLEGLSISTCCFRGSIAPGSVSLRGFQQLRKLEIPLDIAVCNINAAATDKAYLFGAGLADCDQSDDYMDLIGDLVPATVSHLSLLSGGTYSDAKALRLMFQDFGASKQSMLPALEKIHLTCPPDADDAYKKQCANLMIVTEMVDLVLKLWPSFSFVASMWGGDGDDGDDELL